MNIAVASIESRGDGVRAPLEGAREQARLSRNDTGEDALVSRLGYEPGTVRTDGSANDVLVAPPERGLSFRAGASAPRAARGSLRRRAPR